MKITNRIGMLLLAVFLILTGVLMIVGPQVQLTFLPYVLGGLAVAAGCLLLVYK
jgi:uncharacterized membrane protein HdeD (DUF308 family)